nr:thiamine pyrophosphate-dependent enzyme [Micromonospora sp. DSM 115978]
GYAMGVSRDGGDCATVAYFGDGASSEGDVNEAFGWAGVFSLPVVFFCQNNQWAISEPSARQSRAPIYLRARGFGFPSQQVDGNDVLACLAATRWALDTVRSGRGPVLLEAVTYRMGPHTTADDPTRYRSSEEVSTWARRDPVDRMRAYLTDEG